MAIIGSLTHLEYFFNSYPKLEEIYTYMHNAITPENIIHQRIANLTLEEDKNRVELSYPLSNGARAIEQTYYLKDSKEAFYETHRLFVDFQLVVMGYEYMQFGDIDHFEVQQDYDANRDLTVHKKRPELTYSQIILRAGDLAIFFPHDVHAGGLEPYVSNPTQCKVKKSVIKVPIEFFV